VRECATAFLHASKRSGIPVVLVGHVTKQGDIAGPRVLEHIVDVVLFLESEGHQGHRILRGIKNRYGSTDEVCVAPALAISFDVSRTLSPLLSSDGCQRLPPHANTPYVLRSSSIVEPQHVMKRQWAVNEPLTAKAPPSRSVSISISRPAVRKLHDAPPWREA
jgi:hypothetical protein